MRSVLLVSWLGDTIRTTCPYLQVTQPFPSPSGRSPTSVSFEAWTIRQTLAFRNKELALWVPRETALLVWYVAAATPENQRIASKTITSIGQLSPALVICMQSLYQLWRRKYLRTRARRSTDWWFPGCNASLTNMQHHSGLLIHPRR